MDKKQMKAVATKVSPEAFARLNSICIDRGITLYNMLQMFCDCIIRYMDAEHNLSEDLNTIIRMFEGLRAWSKANNLAEPVSGASVDCAFYVLHKDGRAGDRVAMVRQTFDGIKETYNIQDATDRFIEAINPTLYNHLTNISVDLDTNGTLETIYKLADLYKEDPNDAELRRTFENNDWVGNSQRMSGVQYQRHNSHTMDLFEQ